MSIWYRDGSEYSGPYVSTLPGPPVPDAPAIPDSFEEETTIGKKHCVGRLGVSAAGGKLIRVTMEALGLTQMPLAEGNSRDRKASSSVPAFPSNSEAAMFDSLDLAKVPAQGVPGRSPGSDSDSDSYSAPTADGRPEHYVGSADK